MLKLTRRKAIMVELTEIEFVKRMKCLPLFYLTKIITVKSISDFDSSNVSVKHTEVSLQAILFGGQS